MLPRREKHDCHPQHIVNSQSVPVHTKHKSKSCLMHVVMNMLRGIPDEVLHLELPVVWYFCMVHNKRRGSKTHLKFELKHEF